MSKKNKGNNKGKNTEATNVIVSEVSISVVAREASTKDAEGNSIKGKILDEGKVYQYTLNQAGHDAYLKRYDVKRMMEKLNRQEKTDVRNDLAAKAKAPEKGIKTKCKVMVDMIKSNSSLKPIFIKEVESWVHIDATTRGAIIDVLKSV